ncbi:phage portal protein [Streptomyces sp. NPDC059513]|uniref:phage portal protein n=1 Tax=unclassified Streptomyces TaxID=2593676 RepID=UPI0036807EB4
MAIAIDLPTLEVSEDELAQVEYMLKQLDHYRARNKVAEDYYEGRNKLKNLNITIPDTFRNLQTVVGWAGTAVDVLDERLEWQGWTSVDGDDLGLTQIYNQNDLDADSGLGHLDALIYGTSFVVVGAADEGEPSPLITIESAKNMTGIWNARTRRLDAALGVNSWSDTGAQEVTLYTAYSNITLQKNGSFWRVVDRDDHELGRVMVAQMWNRPRGSVKGRSEITKAIRSYVDEGMRTMLGMTVNREFYSVPQRYILGADAAMFLDTNGNPTDSWATVAGRMTALPDPVRENEVDSDPTGRPTIGQFPAASPAPYLEQLKGLSVMVAGEAGIPAGYFGFVTANPSSADAMRVEEARLIKRAERRQLMFGKTWMEVGKLAVLVRDGRDADLSAFENISVKWKDAATPTRSAAADEATKLISAGVLPAESTVTYDRIGLNPQEQRQLVSDRRQVQASQRLADISAALRATDAGQGLTEAPTDVEEAA